MTNAAIDTSVFRPGLLDGQVALVTGGGTGIGFGIAELLATLGMHVVLASRKSDHVEPAAERLRASGAHASAVTLDVRDPDRVRAVFTDVADRLGRFDLLVNNAAGNFYVPSESMSPNAWRSVIEIDLFGTFFCAQAVLPHLRTVGGGSIINISMTLHYRGWPQMAHATAAKGGIDALTRTLAVEWARHKIRINAIAPGPVDTPGAAERLFPDPMIMEGIRQTIPLRRFAALEEVANAAAYLMSDYASYVTGENFVIDGGQWLSGADYFTRLKQMMPR